MPVLTRSIKGTLKTCLGTLEVHYVTSHAATTLPKQPSGLKEGTISTVAQNSTSDVLSEVAAPAAEQKKN